MARTSLDRLARDVAAEAGHIDPDTVKEVYRAIVRTMMNGIRKDGHCRMPKLGTFRVVTQQPRRIGSIDGSFGGQAPVTVLGERQVLKFSPSEEIRVYVRDSLALSRDAKMRSLRRCNL